MISSPVGLESSQSFSIRAFEAEWSFRGESNAGENRFLHFAQTNGEGNIPAGIRVQVNPQVMLTYYIEHQFFGSEDADRLEPGNG